MLSMSVEDSGSEAIGSAGIGSGSRTGSGGVGGRFPPVGEPTADGGVVGFATGAFFLAQAPAPASAIATMTNTRRLCIIVSILSRIVRCVPISVSRSRRLRYCDQFG